MITNKLLDSIEMNLTGFPLKNQQKNNKQKQLWEFSSFFWGESIYF